MPNQLAIDFIQSRDSYMRTGKLIFYDDMEDLDANATVHYQHGFAGHDGTIGSDITRAFSGAKSLKIVTGAIAAGDNLELLRRVGLRKFSSDVQLPLGIFGLEFKWMTETAAAAIREIYAEIQLYDGTNLWRAAIKWLGEANLKWQYMNNAGAFADIAGGTESINVGTNDVWQYFKMNFEVFRQMYGYVFSNNKFLLLSGGGLATRQVANATLPQLQIVIGVTTAGAAAVTVFIDDIILTYDEEFK